MPQQQYSRRTWLRSAAASAMVVALAACGKTAASTPSLAVMNDRTSSSAPPAPSTASTLAASQETTATETASFSAVDAVTSATTAMARAVTGAPVVTAVSVTTTATDSAVPEPALAAAPPGVLAAPPVDAAAPPVPVPHLPPIATVGVPRSAVLATPQRASLGPLDHITQTLNNCGPASVSEVLSYWGVSRSQSQVQAFLRADGNPNGMVSYGVPSYARGLGFGAVVGAGGNRALVKALVANGLPPIANQWVSLTDHVGHYRPIESFDDSAGVFVSSDPFLGADHAIDYLTFDRIWATNSGRFLLLYPLAKQATVQAVLAAAGWNKTAAYRNDLAKLQRRLALHQSPDDGGSRFWQGHGALAVAWDNLELGQLAAARAALDGAQAQHANPVIVNWIAREIAIGTA